jgi:hypothetical protein
LTDGPAVAKIYIHHWVKKITSASLPDLMIWFLHHVLDVSILWPYVFGKRGADDEFIQVVKRRECFSKLVHVKLVKPVMPPLIKGLLWKPGESPGRHPDLDAPEVLEPVYVEPVKVVGVVELFWMGALFL